MLHARLTFTWLTVAAAFVAISGVSRRTAAQIPDVPGWKLFFHDEFDGTNLNTTKWEALRRENSFNNEKQYYLPEQVAVANGNLQITATNQPVPNTSKQYRSGLITSKELYGPGRFEARIDLPTGKGIWPAFWLNANQLQWPLGGEIDIMEHRGSKPTKVISAFHWQKDPGDCCANVRSTASPEYGATVGGNDVNFTTGFHTYATEWDTDKIRFFVDGNLHFTVLKNSTTMSNANFTTVKNIIVNVAVGGHFDGDPDGTTMFPQTMLVDYVRVWQRQTGLSGDYNGDQRVDAADYAVWRKSLGQSGIGLPADGSGNGTVDDQDYLMWKQNFGAGGGAGNSVNTVPEPGCVTLMTFGLLRAFKLRNSRCQQCPQIRF